MQQRERIPGVQTQARIIWVPARHRFVTQSETRSENEQTGEKIFRCSPPRWRSLPAGRNSAFKSVARQDLARIDRVIGRGACDRESIADNINGARRRRGRRRSEVGFSAGLHHAGRPLRGCLMSPFQDLLERVRAGDDSAASEIFQRYEADVKRVVRAMMRVEWIRRGADPSDIYQSVMASFFIRIALGQYDISTPDQLRALLTRIARNKVTDMTRSPNRRVSVVPVAGPDRAAIEPADPAKGPASQVMWKELFHKVRDRFTEAERRVSDLRMMNHSWEEVGAALGEKADAVRMRLDRALKRIGHEMNIEELSDD